MNGRWTMGVAAPVVAAALLASGCGSSAPHATAPNESPTAKAAVPTELAAALRARLQAQDGPLVSPSSASIQTAEEVRIASGGQERAAATLDAAGTESLTTKGGNHGVRVVFHFPDAAAAMADHKLAVSDSGPSKTSYNIPEIPGAVGTDDTGKGGCGCRYVNFVIGNYEYRLGLSTTASPTPTRAQFIAMTQAWYANVKKLG